VYHVTLNGQGFVLDLSDKDGYSRRLFDPFASKLGGGQRSYTDLKGTEQAISLSDWSGGEGQAQHDLLGPNRYRAAEGIDAYTERGTIRLGPDAPQRVNTAANEVSALGIYNGHLMIGLQGGTVFRWDGVNPAVVVGVCAGSVRSIESMLGVCYFGVEGSGQVSSCTTAWAFTAAKFTVAGSVGVYALRTFYRQSVQYLYVGSSASGAGGVAAIHWYDGVTLSPVQYDPEEVFVLAAEVLGNRLYFLASDISAPRLGIYSVDDQGGGGVYRCHVRVPGAYCWGAAVYQGTLYLLLGPNGRIATWDGTTLTEIYRVGTPAAPYPSTMYGIAEWQGALWIGFQDSAGTQGLLRFDGASWSRPVLGIPGVAIRKLHPYAGQLAVASQATGASKTYLTSTSFRTTGTLETSLLDTGVPSEPKVLREVTMVHSSLTSGQSVQIQYRLEDTGSWTTLGTSSGLGSTVVTFTFPISTVCRQLGLRLVLGGPGGASTPVLHEVLVRYGLLPVARREWVVTVVLEGTATAPLKRLDGTDEPLTGKGLSDALWAARDSQHAVIFSDLDDASRRVWIEDIDERPGKLTQRNGYQARARVRLVEAS